MLSARIVHEGKEGIVERLGRYQRTLKPGLNFVAPLLDRVKVVSTREQLLDIEPQVAMTRDNVTVMVTAVAYWKITRLERAYYSVENIEEAFKSLMLTTLRSEIGQRDLREALCSRDAINQALLRQLDKATYSWGVVIIRVEIVDISLPESVRAALEFEIIAESKRRAKISEIDGEIEFSRRKSKSSISEAEYLAEAQKIRIIAEAEAQVEASNIKDSILIQQTQRLIEISKLKTEAEKSGVKLTWEQLQKVDEAVRQRQADTAGLVFNVHNHQEATAKAMNNSEDKSMKAGGNLFNNPGTINNQGGNINLGTISGDVTNAINQLPEPTQPDKPNIKELLTELQKALEAEPSLPDQEKVDALDDIKKLVEAAAKPEDKSLKEAVPKAMRNINRIASSAAQTATGLVTIVGKLSPLILGFFAL